MSLRPGRGTEIAEMMLNRDGGMFPCHKTTHGAAKEEIHCAGALAFAEKNGNATQMMRIAERCRLYDHEKIKPAWPMVFDTVEEMEAHLSRDDKPR